MGKRRGRDSEDAHSSRSTGALARISLNTPRVRRASRSNGDGGVGGQVDLLGKENQCVRGGKKGGGRGDGGVEGFVSRKSLRVSMGSAAAVVGKGAQGSACGGGEGLAGKGNVTGCEEEGRLQEPVHWRLNQLATDLSPEMREGDAIAEEAGLVRLPVGSDQTDRPLTPKVVLPTILRAYDKLRTRYNRIKARKLDVEVQIEEQRRFNQRFQQVADGYIRDLCNENEHLRKSFEESHSETAQNRMKWLEMIFFKCQNDNIWDHQGNFEFLHQNLGDQLAGSAKAPSLVQHSLTPPPTNLAIESIAIEDESFQDEANHIEAIHLSEQAEHPPMEGACALHIEDGELRDAIESQDKEDSRGPEQEQQTDPKNTVTEEIAVNQNLHSPEINKQSEMLTPAAMTIIEASAENPSSNTNPALVSSKKAEIVAHNLHTDFDASFREAELKDQHSKEVTGLLSECDLLRKLLGQLMDLSIVSDETARARRGPATLIFCHRFTGLKFKLEYLKDLEAQPLGGKSAFLYKNVDLGTLASMAPQWMQEDIVITLDQLENFTTRLHNAARGCF